jgi:hypothetical protein
MGDTSSKQSADEIAAHDKIVCKTSTLALFNPDCQKLCESEPAKPCDALLKESCKTKEYYDIFPYCKTICGRYPELCKNVMDIQDYCFSGVDQFTSERCQSYCFNNELLCNRKKKEYCSSVGAAANSPVCRNFCFNNPGQCDDAIKTYCDMNPADSLCSCITSIANNPVCYDNKCFLTGYKTSEHIQQKEHDVACDALNCDEYFKLMTSDAIDFKDDQGIKDNCAAQCSNSKQGCDTFMDHYCKESTHFNTEACSCINSDYKKLGYNPVCHDPTCKQYGYTGTLIKGNSCPEHVACDDVTKKYPNIYNKHCAQKSLPLFEQDDVVVALTPTPSPTMTPDPGTSTWLYVGIGVGGLIIIIGIGSVIMYIIMKK